MRRGLHSAVHVGHRRRVDGGMPRRRARRGLPPRDLTPRIPTRCEVAVVIVLVVQPTTAATVVPALITGAVAVLAIVVNTFSTALTLRHQRRQAGDDRRWHARSDLYVSILAEQAAFDSSARCARAGLAEADAGEADVRQQILRVRVQALADRKLRIAYEAFVYSADLLKVEAARIFEESGPDTSGDEINLDLKAKKDEYERRKQQVAECVRRKLGIESSWFVERVTAIFGSRRTRTRR